MHDISEKDLIDNGYYEINKNDLLCSEFVEKAYQKKVVDNIGIKYYIECFKYKQLKHPITGDDLLFFQYKFDIQLHNENDKTIDLQLCNGWSIKEVEDFVENVFKTQNCLYYELKDY